MSLSYLRLKKKEDRRIRAGHPWIFSNEIDTKATPLKSFQPGQEVTVVTQDGVPLGSAYVNPHSLIAARVYCSDANASLDLAFFIKKLSLSLALRTRVINKPFYRLAFSEADDLPGLVVDRFGDALAVQINTAGMEQKKDLIITALREVLPTTTSILLRNDSPIRKHEGLTTYIEPAFGQPPETVTLEENGILFHAPFSKGQKTGWFYDHRDNRAKLQRYVAGANVLDVFSYLGAFGIQAAVFGAKHVDCIETSAFASDMIRQNAALNHVHDQVNVITDDAFDAMKALLQAGKSYDVIILDPPAFVKKNKDRKEGLIAYQRINELALKLLKSNGILVTCSCSMHVSLDDLVSILQRSAYNTRQAIQILERGHQGPDHPIHLAIPETDYLKAIFARKKS